MFAIFLTQTTQHKEQLSHHEHGICGQVLEFPIHSRRLNWEVISVSKREREHEPLVAATACMAARGNGATSQHTALEANDGFPNGPVPCRRMPTECHRSGDARTPADVNE